MSKPRVGISACLLGQKVRYDGNHKKHDWIAGELKKHVTFVPLCPEMEMGLGCPRETIGLYGDPADPRLLSNETRQDLTELARRTARRVLAASLKLDGYIFKADSPSCGLHGVRVHGKAGTPPRKIGRGLFAAEVLRRFGPLPVTEEGSLVDPEQREHFVIALFCWARFRALPQRAVALQKFHESHKLFLMSRNAALCTKLGRLAGNSDRSKDAEARATYGALLFEALQRRPRRATVVNALEHMAGYFKRDLPAAQKQRLRGLIAAYRDGDAPLGAVLSVMRKLAARYSVAYLRSQAFFELYPPGLLTSP